MGTSERPMKTIYLLTEEIARLGYVGQTWKHPLQRYMEHWGPKRVKGVRARMERAGHEHWRMFVIGRAPSQETANHAEAYFMFRYETLWDSGLNLEYRYTPMLMSDFEVGWEEVDLGAAAEMLSEPGPVTEAQVLRVARAQGLRVYTDESLHYMPHRAGEGGKWLTKEEEEMMCAGLPSVRPSMAACLVDKSGWRRCNAYRAAMTSRPLGADWRYADVLESSGGAEAPAGRRHGGGSKYAEKHLPTEWVVTQEELEDIAYTAGHARKAAEPIRCEERHDRGARPRSALGGAAGAASKKKVPSQARGCGVRERTTAQASEKRAPKQPPGVNARWARLAVQWQQWQKAAGKCRAQGAGRRTSACDGGGAV